MKFKSAESGIQSIYVMRARQSDLLNQKSTQPVNSPCPQSNFRLLGWLGAGGGIHIYTCSISCSFHFSDINLVFFQFIQGWPKIPMLLILGVQGRSRCAFEAVSPPIGLLRNQLFLSKPTPCPRGSACFNCTTSSLASDFRSTPLRGSPVQLLSQVSKLLDPGSSPACLASGCRDIADQELIWGLPRTDLGAATSNQPQSRL